MRTPNVLKLWSLCVTLLGVVIVAHSEWPLFFRVIGLVSSLTIGLILRLLAKMAHRFWGWHQQTVGILDRLANDVTQIRMRLEGEAHHAPSSAEHPEESEFVLEPEAEA